MAYVETLVQEALDEKERDRELVFEIQVKEKGNNPNWSPVPDGYTLISSTPIHEFISKRLTTLYSLKAERMEKVVRKGQTVVAEVP